MSIHWGSFKYFYLRVRGRKCHSLPLGACQFVDTGSLRARSGPTIHTPRDNDFSRYDLRLLPAK